MAQQNLARDIQQRLGRVGESSGFASTEWEIGLGNDCTPEMLRAFLGELERPISHPCTHHLFAVRIAMRMLNRNDAVRAEVQAVAEDQLAKAFAAAVRGSERSANLFLFNTERAMHLRRLKADPALIAEADAAAWRHRLSAKEIWSPDWIKEAGDCAADGNVARQVYGLTVAGRSFLGDVAVLVRWLGCRPPEKDYVRAQDHVGRTTPGQLRWLLANSEPDPGRPRYLQVRWSAGLTLFYGLRREMLAAADDVACTPQTDEAEPTVPA